VEVTIEDAKGGNVQKVDVETVLVAVGRRPYTEGLGLKVTPAFILQSVHSHSHYRKWE
jgi:dihydrolipoamide dehydrogenase